jgi:hypothetical protein
MTTTTDTTIRRFPRDPGFYRSDRCHVAGPDDFSPVHHTYPTGYDSECSWCWLGHTHSEEAHAASLKA